MQLQDAISKRRTLREFSVRPVSDKIIDKALSAGLKAPSYNHLRQWDFILVNDSHLRLALTKTEPMKDELDEKTKALFDGYDSAAREMYLYAIPQQKRMILTAPGLICVVYKPKTQIKHSQRVYDLNCLASVWCCIENILLSFAEDDVFGVTFIPQDTPKVKEVLGIPPTHEVAALIPFGYKADEAQLPLQKEVSLTQRKHIDKF
jgi:nitroreductase